MKQNSLLKVCICLLLIFLTACSTHPVFYSESQINRYVHRVFGDEWTLTDADKETHTYIYENEQGEQFSVCSKESHSFSIDGANAPVYEKFLSHTYLTSRFEARQSELQEIIDESGLSISLLPESSSVSVYLNSTDEFRLLSEVILQLDSVLEFYYHSEKSSLHDNNAKTSICIRLRPANIATTDSSWKKDFKTMLCEIPFSYDEDERWTTEDCFTEMIRGLKDYSVYFPPERQISNLNLNKNSASVT